MLNENTMPTCVQGIDLICDNYEWLMSQGVQLIMLGSGREDLEWALRDMENRWALDCPDLSIALHFPCIALLLAIALWAYMRGACVTLLFKVHSKPIGLWLEEEQCKSYRDHKGFNALCQGCVVHPFF
jgi:hypothetical protein